MSARKPPDWTRMGTLAGYAKYLREQSGALMDRSALTTIAPCRARGSQC
jgi:hypothetical protein